MFRALRLGLLLLLPFLPGGRLLAQGQKGHLTVSFDDKGKLEDANAWKKSKADITNRKPRDIFLVTHGWRTSKTGADVTFTYFGKHLREHEKDAAIEVIGIRWPSLIGETDTLLDLAFKAAVKVIAKGISKSMADSKSADERKATIKAHLKKHRSDIEDVLKFRLPPEEELNKLVDNFDSPENVESLLSTLSYYEMKRRAATVGATGVQACLTELQEALPDARFHLIGHSFGCKVWLSCLASEDRANRQVHSVTLLQGAVSSLCFAPKIDELKGAAGAYADVPKRVKGPIAITFTKNDKALTVAYLAASQAAGHVAELPARQFHFSTALYGALGARGFTSVADVALVEPWNKNTAYKLRAGLNAFNADEVIQDHGDYRQEAVTNLIWSTARFQTP